MRREFTLPDEDIDWLESQGGSYELISEGKVLRVVLYDFPVPPGYNMNSITANVRIDAAYPDTQIDMVYFYPALALKNGQPIKALSTDKFDGKVWQRWSRHRTPANPWRPGIDNLSTHFALVQNWIEREARK
jgi:hypothetical protein